MGNYFWGARINDFLKKAWNKSVPYAIEQPGVAMKLINFNTLAKNLLDPWRTSQAWTQGF